MDCVSTYRHHWNDLNVADKQQLKNVCMEIIDKVGSLSVILSPSQVITINVCTSILIFTEICLLCVEHSLN